MSPPVYRIVALLAPVLSAAPVGTNLGLLQLLFALVSGRFLSARGALFPALSQTGLPRLAVCRAAAALAYGRWQAADLLAAWGRAVEAEGGWQPHAYEGVRPRAVDLTGFFRPKLAGCAGKHYRGDAGKAVPAVVFALVASVGSAGQQRLAQPRLLLRQGPGETEAQLQRRALREAARTLPPEEALVCDAGFALADLFACDARFVVRMRTNATARRAAPPAYSGRGRRPSRGERVRFLPGVRAGRDIPATPPDATTRWHEAGREITAAVWSDLVLPDAPPGAAHFHVVAVSDPRYPTPLLLATNLSVSPYALWRLYRDRWPIEQMPLAAKQMLGCERAFVCGQESRHRLPELALLAGSVLSYVAATSQPVATGFWDRAARPTCGRLRRALSRLDFAELPLPGGQLRKKESVTAHLPKGVEAHRRTKASPAARQAARDA